MTKRVVIVRRTCHEFANKLWSDMSVYAYALAANAVVWNLAALETGPFAALHRVIAYMVGLRGPLVQYTFLPPTVPLEGKFAEKDTVYFFGWLFRNPEGFRVYRNNLLSRFGPSAREEGQLNRLLVHVPEGRILVGVHLRLNPLPYFPSGEFLVRPDRVRDIVIDYLQERKIARERVALVVVSDRPVRDLFADFVVCEPGHNDRTDFLLLSKCSVIVGTNTSFCNLAAWFGDVPHIVTTEEAIDWAYYANRDRFFDNKYATFAFGMPIDGRK